MKIYRSGMDLYENQCNGRFLTGDRDSDCELHEGKLLMCDHNSIFGKKLQGYLDAIGYTERS